MAKKRTLQDPTGEVVSEGYVNGVFQAKVKALIERDILPKYTQYKAELAELKKQGTKGRDLVVWPSATKKNGKNVGKKVYVMFKTPADTKGIKVAIIARDARSNVATVQRVKLKEGEKEHNAKPFGGRKTVVAKSLIDLEQYGRLTGTLDHIKRVFKAYDKDIDVNYYKMIVGRLISKVKHKSYYWSEVEQHLGDIVDEIIKRFLQKTVWPGNKIPDDVEERTKVENGFRPFVNMNLGQAFADIQLRPRKEFDPFSEDVVSNPNEGNTGKLPQRYRVRPQSLEELEESGRNLPIAPTGSSEYYESDVKTAYRMTKEKALEFIPTLGGSVPRHVKYLWTKSFNYVLKAYLNGYDIKKIYKDYTAGTNGALIDDNGKKKRLSPQILKQIKNRGVGLQRFADVLVFVSQNLYQDPKGETSGVTVKQNDRDHTHKFHFDVMTGKGYTEEGWDNTPTVMNPEGREHKHDIVDGVVEDFGVVKEGERWVRDGVLGHTHDLPKNARGVFKRRRK